MHETSSSASLPARERDRASCSTCVPSPAWTAHEPNTFSLSLVSMERLMSFGVK